MLHGHHSARCPPQRPVIATVYYHNLHLAVSGWKKLIKQCEKNKKSLGSTPLSTTENNDEKRRKDLLQPTPPKVLNLGTQTGVGERFFRRSSMTLMYSRWSTEEEILVISMVPMRGLPCAFVPKTRLIASWVTPL